MAELSPIEAHQRAIGRVFCDDYAFEIPAYQRPYAWEREQAVDLLTDLLDAMDNTNASGGVYFLGSIVLITSPGSTTAKVVDGQQRLTTLTILLSLLRDLTSDEEARFDRRTYIYQKANNDKGTSNSYRLSLREQDTPFFRKHIQDVGATNVLPNPDHSQGSQQRIADNAHVLKERLSAMKEIRRDELMAFLIQHCYLVVVAVPTADAARRIFTVLNARGLDLTATDILKADLLERAGSPHENGLAKRWEAAELSLGRDAFVELFGHIRMIYERDKPRSALESAFRSVVPTFAGNAENFVTNVLEPIVDAYALLDNPEEVECRFGIDAAKAVRSLQRIDSKDWVAPAILRLWHADQSAPIAIATFLKNLERAAYYLFVTRADVNQRIGRFTAIMDEYEPRPGRAPASPGLVLTSEEQRELASALDGPLYKHSRVCKPVLQRLDEALSSGGAYYHSKVISVEHVLPQTVADGSEWADTFPTDTEREAWLHRLANLVFLTRRINTRASNWPFEKKKAEYFGSKDGISPFPLTQDVQNTATWTAAALQARQIKLCALLFKVWALEELTEH